MSERKSSSRKITEQIIDVIASSDKSSDKEASGVSNSTDLLAPPDISRRTFLGLVSLTAGAVAAEELLGNVVFAYADEEGNYSFVITVISKEELGVIAVDVANQNAPLQDMEITITSLCNGKTRTARTDQYGKAIINIRELAEDPSEDALEYSFWGRVYAKKSGYRDFETGKMRLVAGPKPAQAKTGFVIPSQKQNGRPYARLITFDGFDIQYSTSTFAPCKGNDIDHALVLKVSASSGTQLKARMIHGSIRREMSGTAGGEGVATFEFTDKWAQEFSVGTETKIEVQSGNDVITITTKLRCIKAVMDAASHPQAKLSPGNTKAAALAPDDDENSLGWTCTLPEAIPVIGGLSFDIDLPYFPVWLVIEPQGSIGIGIGMESPDLADEKGKFSWDEWKKANRETRDESKLRQFDKWGKALDAFEASKAIKQGREPNMGTKPYFSNLEAKFSFAFLALGDWDIEKNQWGAHAKAMAIIALKYELARQFYIAGFPVYIGFDLGISVALQLGLGMTFTGTDLSSITWHQETGFKITNSFEIGVSAGAGISGVVSVGLRGYGNATAQLDFNFVSGKTFPHNTLDLSAALTYVAQFFMFKTSGQIYGKTWEKWYDNWRGAAQLDEGDGVALPAYPGFETSGGFSDEFEPITDSEFDQSIEFTATESVSDPDVFEYAYYEGDGGSVTGADCSAVGVESIGALGVKPSTEKKVYSGILSDPRTKVVDVAGDLYAFRLVSVKYGMLTWRTRLTFSKFDGTRWGEPVPIEFKHADSAPVKRVDVNDYDFDILVWSNGILEILLHSGYREYGDLTSLENALNHTVLTYLKFYISSDGKRAENFEHREYYNFYKMLASGEKMKFVGAPQIVRSFDLGYFAVALYTKTVNGKQVTRTKMLRYWENRTEAQVDELKLESEFENYTFVNFVMSQVPLENSIHGFCGVLQIKDDKSQRVESWWVRYLSFEVEIICRKLTNFSGVPVRNPIGGFLYASNKGDTTQSYPLISLTTRLGDPNEKQVGKIDSAIFGVSADGKSLYTSMVKDASSQAAVGSLSVLDEGAAKQEYWIMSSKWYEGANGFSNFFPFAQVDHPVDQLSVSNNCYDRMNFLFSSITDMKKCTADLYYASVPWVKCVDLAGAAVEEVFAGAGDVVHLMFTVENIGNVAVKSFSIAVYDNKDKTGQPLARFDFNDLKAAMSPSLDQYDIDEETVVLTAADQAGIMLPGTRRFFSNVKFKVPSSWRSGNHELFAFVVASECALDGPFAEEIPGGTLLDYPDVEPAMFALDSDGSDSFNAKDLAISANDYTLTTLNSDGSGESASPSTGDGDMSSIAAALAAALGLGVAGVTGYEIRRHENEAGTDTASD